MKSPNYRFINFFLKMGKEFRYLENIHAGDVGELCLGQAL